MLWIIILTFLTVCHGNQLQSRITGGSKDDESIFIVSVQYQGKHYCAGTLFTKKVVFTAAHCLYGLPIYSISVKTTGGTYYSIDGFINHPNYRKGSMSYDIGSIILSGDLNYDEKFELPKSAISSGERLYISGWGSTTPSGSPHPDDFPNRAIVTTISLQACRDSYTQNDVTSTMLCTVGAGACYTDDGGPLYGYSKDGFPILYGVISWGKSCQNGNMPLVYSDVYQLGNFISWFI